MSDSERARLRWRCRRGMGELDQLLVRWLEVRWEQADDSRKADFSRLLDVEDDRLWAWVTGRQQPDDARLQQLIDELVG